MSKAITIERTIRAEEANWPAAMAVLSEKYNLTTERALQHVESFLKRLHRPLNLYWFISNKLSRIDNNLIAALCECCGADSLKLVTQRYLRVPWVPCEISQELTVKPSFKRDSEDQSVGLCSSKVIIKVFNLKLTIQRAINLLLVQLVIFLFAALFSAIVLGLMAYCSAVLLLLIFVPSETTIAATQDARVGIAVLGILLVIAATFGRAARNLFAKLVGVLRT